MARDSQRWVIHWSDSVPLRRCPVCYVLSTAMNTRDLRWKDNNACNASKTRYLQIFTNDYPVLYILKLWLLNYLILNNKWLAQLCATQIQKYKCLTTDHESKRWPKIIVGAGSWNNILISITLKSILINEEI